MFWINFPNIVRTLQANYLLARAKGNGYDHILSILLLYDKLFNIIYISQEYYKGHGLGPKGHGCDQCVTPRGHDLKIVF